MVESAKYSTPDKSQVVAIIDGVENWGVRIGEGGYINQIVTAWVESGGVVEPYDGPPDAALD